MSKSAPPVLGKPTFELTNPAASLSLAKYEILTITAEDLNYLAHLVGEEWIDSAPEIRAFSTMLRRLLCDGDLHKAARLAAWTEPFTVRARVLDYPSPHPHMIVTCGGFRWGSDLLPDSATMFGGTGIPEPPKSWSITDHANLTLQEYLDSLAFAIIGTGVKRRDVISFVANKKAAHISDERKRPAHEVLDHLWHGLFMHRRSPDGSEETLNAVYLELLTIMHTIGESESIRNFARHLTTWLSSATVSYGPEVQRAYAMKFPITKLD